MNAALFRDVSFELIRSPFSCGNEKHAFDNRGTNTTLRAMNSVRNLAAASPLLLALVISGCGAGYLEQDDYDAYEAQFEDAGMVDEMVPMAAARLDQGTVKYCGRESMPIVVGSQLKVHKSTFALTPHRITGTVMTKGGPLELDVKISVSVMDLTHMTVKSGTSVFEGVTTELKPSTLDIVVNGSTIQSLKGTVETACNRGIFLDVSFASD